MIQILSYILMGVSVLLAALFYTGVISEEPIIIWCYALAIAAAAAALIFPVFALIGDPKGAKVALVGILALGVVAGISYAVAGNEVTAAYATYGTTELSSKLVSTGLILFYLLASGAVIAAVYAEVSKIFK
ncbi:MAG: hypothetical protein H0V01_01005 [Bacteroidetes bacterium]|nr:hypothetical protein [Bacteroidota bacterium]HET6243756.1 hypothetical protein [Bacteroidia bacterium]